MFCGEVCCALGEVCNFTKCELPGAVCKQGECGDGEFCDFTLGEPVMMPDPNCMGGVVEPTGKCLTKPPLAEAGGRLSSLLPSGSDGAVQANSVDWVPPEQRSTCAAEKARSDLAGCLAILDRVLNVEEDGSIPAVQLPNWSTPGLNNFRQNKQPDSEFAAPDVIVSIAPLCQDDSYSLVAVVRKVGEASLPAGVVVGFYTGDPPTGTKVGELMTSKALYPLDSEILVLPFDAAPDDVKNGIINIYAVVDDTKIPHPAWQECRTDNNIGTSTGKCLVPN